VDSIKHERSTFPAVNGIKPAAINVLHFFKPAKSTTKTNAAHKADTAKRPLNDMEQADRGAWIVDHA
jgi:hypothetical protein